MFNKMKTPKDSTLKNCIWETKNYSMFKFIDCNRDIVKSHIKNLTGKMKEKELEQPIVVKQNGDGRYNIMEGQHRYTVARENSLPVYYMIENTLTLNDIITMNTVKKSTSKDDFLKWYYVQAQKGESKYSNYIIYHDFVKKYKLEKQKHKAVMLVEGTYMRPNKYWDAFKCGELQIKDLKKSCRLIEQFDDVGKFLKDIRKLGNSIFYAYMEAFNSPEYDHKRMMDQLAKPIVVLAKQVDKDAYQKQINTSYNKGIKKPNHVDLFDYLKGDKQNEK